MGFTLESLAKMILVGREGRKRETEESEGENRNISPKVGGGQALVS